MNIRAYGIVTAAYWGQTITDGALHMLVLLHFHTLGFTPFQLALLFVLYELMGVVTNLWGGWLAARFGLTTTLYAGLGLQILALALLAGLDPAWPVLWSVAYATALQGLAGIAKDLTKMSAKSSIKLIVAEDAQGVLFKWVALLTGSKNAMKGLGFFIGGLLLATLGFTASLLAMAAVLAVILAATLVSLQRGLGRPKAKPAMHSLLAKAPAINRLSVARFFLFGARDIWFVVAVPIFLYEVAGWSFVEVSTFLALWVMGYGVVQALAPRLMGAAAPGVERQALHTEVRAARLWVLGLAALPLVLILALVPIVPWPFMVDHALRPAAPIAGAGVALAIGLGLFGAVFALNSSLHSYLILAYSRAEDVAMDVGFYYMANAGGRLVGCLLSGLVYQAAGIAGSLAAASAFLVASWLAALTLPVATVHRSSIPA